MSKSPARSASAVPSPLKSLAYSLKRSGPLCGNDRRRPPLDPLIGIFFLRIVSSKPTLLPSLPLPISPHLSHTGLPSKGFPPNGRKHLFNSSHFLSPAPLLRQEIPLGILNPPSLNTKRKQRTPSSPPPFLPIFFASSPRWPSKNREHPPISHLSPPFSNLIFPNSNEILALLSPSFLSPPKPPKKGRAFLFQPPSHEYPTCSTDFCLPNPPSSRTNRRSFFQPIQPPSPCQNKNQPTLPFPPFPFPNSTDRCSEHPFPFPIPHLHPSSSALPCPFTRPPTTQMPKNPGFPVSSQALL